jgi:hypothetical protein
MFRNRLIGLSLAVAAALVLLVGCSRDCPSCDSLTQPQPTPGPSLESFAFTLCVSEVPVFAGEDGTGCGEVVVEFVAALP